MEDAERLLDLLPQHPQVKFVCCGHIHHEMTCSLTLRGVATIGSQATRPQSLLMLTTPATSVQFLPETDRLIPDLIPPGFRIFDLETDGSFRTRVVRVPLS